jgi:hypothetical protein
MSATDQVAVQPVPARIENVQEWQAISQQIASESGLPTQVTPDLVSSMVGGAVGLLYRADSTKDASILRGTFADGVIAQCQRFAGSMMSGRPLSVAIELVGARMSEGHPVLRTHLTVEVEGGDGSDIVTRQFWDLQLGAQVTVGQSQCPNCGAPLATGELVCSHCQTDVRNVVEAPIVVAKIELY